MTVEIELFKKGNRIKMSLNDWKGRNIFKFDGKYVELKNDNRIAKAVGIVEFGDSKSYIDKAIMVSIAFDVIPLPERDGEYYGEVEDLESAQLKYVGNRIVKYDFSCVKAPFPDMNKKDYRAVFNGNIATIYAQLYDLTTERFWLGRHEAFMMKYNKPTGKWVYEGKLKILGKGKVEILDISKMSNFYKFFNDSKLYKAVFG